MAKRETFWTDEKLKELARLYPKSTLRQLEKHFGKPPEKILEAYEYQRMRKLLKMPSYKEKGIRITCFKPATALLSTQYDDLLPHDTGERISR